MCIRELDLYACTHIRLTRWAYLCSPTRRHLCDRPLAKRQIVTQELCRDCRRKNEAAARRRDPVSQSGTAGKVASASKEEAGPGRYAVGKGRAFRDSATRKPAQEKDSSLGREKVRFADKEARRAFSFADSESEPDFCADDGAEGVETVEDDVIETEGKVLFVWPREEGKEGVRGGRREI